MPLSLAQSVAAPADVKPFLIEHSRRDEKSSGNFTPAANLIITSALRTSGLLAFLPDAETRTLLVLLTFLSPNGHIQATLPELATGLHISEGEMRRRLEGLLTLRWQGEPLAYSQSAETGLVRYSPSPHLFALQVNPPSPPMSEPPLENRAGREAVIAYSRARYANPREQVERIIAEQYGHDPAELGDSPEAVARRQLSGLGVPKETVSALFEEHSLEQVTNQLAWLPLRGAKSPARFIVAAVQNNYAPPVGVRLPQSILSSKEPTTEQEPDAAPALLAGVSSPIPQATGEERAAKSAPTEEAHG